MFPPSKHGLRFLLVTLNVSIKCPSFAFNNAIFLDPKQKKLELSSNLSLILSLSLALLINQAKPSSSFLAFSRARVRAQILFLGLSKKFQFSGCVHTDNQKSDFNSMLAIGISLLCPTALRLQLMIHL